jgi:hypothetical protein
MSALPDWMDIPTGLSAEQYEALPDWTSAPCSNATGGSRCPPICVLRLKTATGRSIFPL